MKVKIGELQVEMNDSEFTNMVLEYLVNEGQLIEDNEVKIVAISRETENTEDGKIKMLFNEF